MELVRTSFAILRQLRSVSRSLTRDATRHLVQSLILSRIDYCNVAFASLTQRSMIRLQAVINAAARVVLRVKKFDHISTLMRDELQWLRIGERIKFKRSILVYKCLTTAHHLIWQTRSGRYQMTATGRGCGHQTRLMFSCQEPRLKWVIEPLRSLVHVPGTVFLQLFGKPIARTVNVLVKHPRSGLPPTVLYNLSYLHYITLHVLTKMRYLT